MGSTMRCVISFLLLFLVCGQANSYIEEKIRDLISDMPNHPLNRDSEKLDRFVVNVLSAEHKTGVPWEIIVAVAYRESSLMMNKVGKLGEVGYMQIHGAAISYCREKIGKRPRVKKSRRNNLLCGALWIQKSMDICKTDSFLNGLSMYATGKVCKPKYDGRLRWIINRRLSIARRLGYK